VIDQESATRFQFIDLRMIFAWISNISIIFAHIINDLINILDEDHTLDRANTLGSYLLDYACIASMTRCNSIGVKPLPIVSLKSSSLHQPKP